MKNKLGILIFVSLALAACASSRTNTNATNQSQQQVFKPAVNKTVMPQKTVTKYVPVAMPGQFMKLDKKGYDVTKTSHRKLKGVRAVTSANRKSTREPASEDYINSIMVYNYMPGALYQVYCAPLSVTDIQLQTGEHIVSIAAGDTLRWQVSKTHSGMGARRNEHLLIKPTDADLTNTLVITTDKRTYHLSLHSEDKTYMASVEWRYPQGDNGFVQTFKNDDSDATNNIISQGVNLNQLNFKYRTQLTGGLQPGWMPEMVFNDGNKVYIEFPQKMQEAPTLFVGNAPENDKIVNYRVEGNYYIVDGLPLEFQLRSGQKKPTVVQITYVGK